MKVCILLVLSLGFPQGAALGLGFPSTPLFRSNRPIFSSVSLRLQALYTQCRSLSHIFVVVLLFLLDKYTRSLCSIRTIAAFLPSTRTLPHPLPSSLPPFLLSLFNSFTHRLKRKEDDDKKSNRRKAPDEGEGEVCVKSGSEDVEDVEEEEELISPTHSPFLQQEQQVSI